MRMVVSIPIPGQPTPSNMETVTDMTLLQETKKILPGGKAEVLASVSQQTTTRNGAPIDAPTMDPTLYTFDSQGKITAPKEAVQPGVGIGGISSLLNGTGTSGVGILLPSKPITIGQHWTYPVKAPGISGNGTANASLVKLETIGRYKTARIHSVVKLPIHFLANQSGEVLTALNKDTVEAFGSGTITTDYNFAIAEGKLIRSSGLSAITMKFNPKFSSNGKKIAKPSPALNSVLLNITIKMQMGMNLIE